MAKMNTCAASECDIVLEILEIDTTTMGDRLALLRAQKFIRASPVTQFGGCDAVGRDGAGTGDHISRECQVPDITVICHRISRSFRTSDST
jgi:hypothetical protein